MKKIIALLDKQYPPDHSFVNGMLATTLPHEKDIEIDLLVSRHSFHKVCRYKKAVCLPLLYPRKGICRFLNFIKAVCILNKLIERNKSKEIILFVRNEPIYLLACTFVKKKEIKIIFQSSFPHERALVNFFKRWVARWIYKIAGRRVDSLFAFDSTELSSSSRILMDELIGDIAMCPNQVKTLKIIGHTDRLGSDKYNEELSFNRAEAVANYLITNGIDLLLIMMI